jgi:ABC-type multidrug transport system permease subunit
LQNLAIYPYERDIFYLEEAEFCYSAETFLAQYTLLEIPFEIFTSIIFGVLAAYGCGLKRTPQMFSICAFDSFCILNCGESIGIIFATIFSHTAFAVHVVSVLLSASAVLSGIMSLNVNSFLSALNYLSPVKYLVANLAPYSMRNQVFTCTSSQTLPNGQCSIENGTQVLQLYNLDQGAAMNLMALGICTIVYRLVAYIFLRFRLRYVMEKLHDLMTWLSFFHKSRSILSQSDNN